MSQQTESGAVTEEEKEAPPAPPKEAQTSEETAQKEAEKKEESGLSPEQHLARAREKQDRMTDANPRFKEVYFKLKEGERRIKELEEDSKDWQKIRDHNRALQTQLDTMAKAGANADPEPDFEVDPSAWRKWNTIQRLKEREELGQFQKQVSLDALREIEKGLHEDYEDMASVAQKDAQRDPELHKKIFGSENPFRTGYKYAKEKKDKMEKADREEAERETNKAKIDVEKAGAPADRKSEEESEKLSDEEKRVVKKMFPDSPYEEAAKKYAKQKQAMGR